jgi:hypothetical protein
MQWGIPRRRSIWVLQARNQGHPAASLTLRVFGPRDAAGGTSLTAQFPAGCPAAKAARPAHFGFDSRHNRVTLLSGWLAVEGRGCRLYQLQRTSRAGTFAPIMSSTTTILGTRGVKDVPFALKIRVPCTKDGSCHGRTRSRMPTRILSSGTHGGLVGLPDPYNRMCS